MPIIDRILYILGGLMLPNKREESIYTLDSINVVALFDRETEEKTETWSFISPLQFSAQQNALLWNEWELHFNQLHFAAKMNGFLYFEVPGWINYFEHLNDKR